MPHRNSSFKIPDKVEVHVDFDRKRVVVSCETDDGNLLDVELGYQTINKIHDELRKQTQDY